MVLAVVALCLLVAATTYASTAPVIALDAFGGGGWPARASGDSLSAELPLVAAIAIPAVSLALAWLAASPLGLLLGPLSLLSAAATLGACALLSEHGWGIGNDDPAGTFFDTGVAAITVCAIAAIACARSASAAIALWAGSRIELVPALAATAVGLLAAGALYATRAPLADDLAVALAAGLVIDLVLVRLPLSALVNRRIGSRGE
jgi:hypothetical protein